MKLLLLGSGGTSRKSLCDVSKNKLFLLNTF
jgi:hypothetical protein